MSNVTTNRATSWTALFRLSLRELLLLMAMVALAIASMKYASTAWRTCVYTITMAIYMWAAVVAVIDRGPRQAFAIGMVLVMVIYGVLFISAPRRSEGNMELDLRDGRLPTSRTVKHLFPPTDTIEWRDARTGQILPNYDPANPPAGIQAFRQTRRTPDPSTLMAIAHCWWAMLLGYIGGRFARVIYLRRSDLPRPPNTAYQHDQ
ncbi:MAG TPA: hypothetical protein VHK01_14150 [Lacipirellulaceae bacterium]|jgi:hypothetical protein|nr:hypothetical protein [Lacipirellulaceae bacterium]